MRIEFEFTTITLNLNNRRSDAASDYTVQHRVVGERFYISPSMDPSFYGYKWRFATQFRLLIGCDSRGLGSSCKYASIQNNNERTSAEEILVTRSTKAVKDVTFGEGIYLNRSSFGNIPSWDVFVFLHRWERETLVNQNKRSLAKALPPSSSALRGAIFCPHVRWETYKTHKICFLRTSAPPFFFHLERVYCNLSFQPTMTKRPVHSWIRTKTHMAGWCT